MATNLRIAKVIVNGMVTSQQLSDEHYKQLEAAGLIYEEPEAVEEEAHSMRSEDSELQEPDGVVVAGENDEVGSVEEDPENGDAEKKAASPANKGGRASNKAAK